MNESTTKITQQKTVVEELSDQIEFFGWAFSFFAPALLCAARRTIIATQINKKRGK